VTTGTIGTFSSKKIRIFERTAIKAIKHSLGCVVAFHDSMVQIFDTHNIDLVIWSNSSRPGNRIVELAVFPDDSLYVFYETGHGNPLLKCFNFIVDVFTLIELSASNRETSSVIPVSQKSSSMENTTQIVSDNQVKSSR
jgi:hypothetical protein